MIALERTQLGNRLRFLRRKQNRTLNTLAAASGVSRSMISLIERGQGNPSARVLEQLALGLQVPLPLLFIAEGRADQPPISRASDQPTWRDPESGYVRRTLSPAGDDRQFLMTEVELPAGASVSLLNGDVYTLAEQQVWVLAGDLQLDIGPTRYRLAAGDCMSMAAAEPMTFANVTNWPTRYLVALATLSSNPPAE